MGIASYLKTSLIEWPDKIASVIFTPGCSFRCPFCHNASLVNQTERLTLIDEKQILADLRKRKKWVDAVVVTGGEPTLQKDLSKFLRSLKSLKFLTMIHTNGTRPEIIEELLREKLIDSLAMDLKGDFENYGKYTGSAKPQVSKVKSSIILIVKSRIRYEFRTTVVPGLHNLENLTRLAREMKEMVGNYRWFLQQFQPKNTFDKKFLQVKPYSKEEMKMFQKKLQEIIPNVSLRGV